MVTVSFILILSNHQVIILSFHSLFDAPSLDMYIMTRGYGSIFSISRLVFNYPIELVIPNGFFNRNGIDSFKLKNNGNLKRIVIGNTAFGNVRQFELKKMNELESVVIGESSFTYAKTDDGVKKSTRSDGSYSITNCPKLKSIQIGDYTFSDYHSFQIKSLPSLQSIDIGKKCFYWTSSFSLRSIINN